ncbi:MAG: guanylate kinase [candidate division WOR-3 bacterium]|uniref:Guanylate kinase n=1 Tax=candidate division WOR-3 bacterium TaxID=2052148 RepID=A0A7C4W7D7_UNCW3
MLNSKIFVLVGFSGSGKSTLVRKLLRKDNKNIFYSVSVTTRPKRRGERDAKDYYFVSFTEFQKMIKRKELLEWTFAYGNYYGTPKKPFMKALKEGKKILMDLDIKGAQKIKKQFKEQSKVILVLPPSFSVLKERLEKRKEKELNFRLAKDKKTWQEVLKSQRIFDYYLMNDNLKETIKNLEAIMRVEDLKEMPKLKRR